MSNDERFRDFDAALAEHERKPVTFRLGGRDFEVVNTSAPLMMKVYRALEEGIAGAVYFEALQWMVAEGDREALVAAIESADISIGGVIDIVNWIVQETTGSPFVESVSSADSQSTNGRGLKVVSRSSGSTSKNSRHAAG